MVDWFGKIHVLLLHLPIGVLLLAIFLDWLTFLNKLKVPVPVMRFIYGVGMIAACLTCLTGILLAKSGDYGGDLVDNHQWSGVFTAALSIIAFLFVASANKTVRKGISILVLLSVLITGHLGGSITHGERFLNPFHRQEDEWGSEWINIDNLEEAEIYRDVVRVILNNKCVSCHGPDKMKGKLRMDNRENLVKGGKSGSILVDDRGTSELYRRIHLPINAEEHMPPSNKLQLSEEEILILDSWISLGAPFDKRIGDADSTELFEEALLRLISGQEKILVSEEKNIPAHLPDVVLPEPADAPIQQLRNADVVVLPAGENNPFLEVNFVNAVELTEEHLTLLAELAPHIIRLKWSELQLSEKALDVVGKMENLIKLYLDGTNIKDQHLSKLSHLEHLEYLNINQTAITEKGLEFLNPLPALKAVYAFESGISSGTLLNGSKVITGRYELDQLETDTVRIPY